jgi:hypothetical protein
LITLVGNSHDLLPHSITEEELRDETRLFDNRFSVASALTGERVETVLEHIVALWPPQMGAFYQALPPRKSNMTTLDIENSRGNTTCSWTCFVALMESVADLEIFDERATGGRRQILIL